jgi:hypothetical protein
MGATPDQQLALNFLSMIHNLWLKYPGSHPVKKIEDDFVSALAQICIKALAADVRDTIPIDIQYSTTIDGSLMDGDRLVKGVDAASPLNLRDLVNKVVHGTPTRVVVRDDVVHLHFRNSTKDDWTEAVFSGTQLIQQLSTVLHKRDGDKSQRQEQAIMQFIEKVGAQSFLPATSADNASTATHLRMRDNPAGLSLLARELG